MNNFYLKLSKMILLIAMVTGGISWVQIFKIGAIRIELGNLGRVLVIALFLPLIMTKKIRIRQDVVLIILLIWFFWITALMAFHTDYQGIMVIRMWFVEIMFAVTIFNCHRKSLDFLREIATISVFSLLAMFLVSAHIAGINFNADTTEYFITQNRTYYLSHTLKGIFNAFVVPHNVDLDGYSGSEINRIAASFSLFYCIILLSPKSKSRFWNLLGFIALILASLFTMLLFSTSGVLMFLFATMLFLILRFRINSLSRKSVLVIGGLVVFIAIFMLMGDKLYDYIVLQIESDTTSREGRILQYDGAWNIIGDAPLFGVGYTTFHGAPVHNWLLFSWISSGIVGFIMSLSVYLLIVWKILYMLKYSKGNHKQLPMVFLAISLSFIFVIRTMIGGAGGVGAGAAIIALALFLLIYRFFIIDSKQRITY